MSTTPRDRLHQRAYLWARRGWARVTRAAWPTTTAAIACGLSYWAGQHIAGHPYPFFAPVAAWASLGYTADRSVRKVAETGIGVSIGVWLGDLFAHAVGSGPWQVAVIVFIAVLIARFVGSGSPLATHAGTQAVVLVGLPIGVLSPALGGGFGRWSDALVGAAVATLIAAIIPNNPVRRVRSAAQLATTELAETLTHIAAAVTSGTQEDRDYAINRARSTQVPLNDWAAISAVALNATRINATARRYRSHIAELDTQRVLVDRAIRSTRVVARRAQTLHPGPGADDVAELLTATATATRELAHAIGHGKDLAVAREYLTTVAQQAAPGALGERDWQAQALILVLRSAIVDLLEAAGASEQEARDALAALT